MEEKINKILFWPFLKRWNYSKMLQMSGFLSQQVSLPLLQSTFEFELPRHYGPALFVFVFYYFLVYFYFGIPFFEYRLSHKYSSFSLCLSSQCLSFLLYNLSLKTKERQRNKSIGFYEEFLTVSKYLPLVIWFPGMSSKLYCQIQWCYVME